MTEKQRFLETLLGNGADRFPYYDLEPAEETLARWHREGLPRRVSVADYFDLENHYPVGLTIRSRPFFGKATDLLHDPTAFDRHYDPDDPARYAKNYEQQCKRRIKEGRVLYVDASGGGLLQMLGVGDWPSLLAACEALVHKPAMVTDLLERTTEFYCVCLNRVLSKVSVDYASFYEPIASNAGPVISPAMFERYAIPGYRKVMGLLEKYQVPLRILCTTGGNLSSLLPLLVDAGINGFWISNIQSAHMEYRTLRRRFGKGIALIGGIDAAALTRDETALQKALEETVPPLLESGHYLPCLDDRPRINISFDRYALYRRLLEDIAKRG